MNKLSKNVGIYIVLIVLVVSLVNVFLAPERRSSQEVELLTYTQLLREVDNGNVENVRIDEKTVKGTLKSGKEFTTNILNAGTLSSTLAEKGISVEVVPPPEVSWFTSLLT